MRTLRRLVLLTAITAVVWPGVLPAGAATTPDPCKVIRTSEIAKTFGSTPEPGVRGAREISSASCSFTVPAANGRPAGELIVTVTFANAKSTYESVGRDRRYTSFSEGGVKGLYAPDPLGVVQVLRKSTMLSIQGVFTADVKDELITLAKAGRKRL
jgi:hypothetical protein